MLQLAHRTSAPKATKVSMSTAVWTVMCSEPATFASASGLESPYCARIAISPGISCSARLISLRPNSARLRSATRKSMGASLWEVADFQRISVRSARASSITAVETYDAASARSPGSVARSSGPLWPWSWNMVRVVDVGFEVKRGDHRLRLANIDLGSIDCLRDFGGAGLWSHRDLGRDQYLLRTEVQRLHVDDPLDARCIGQRSLDPSDSVTAGSFT